MLTNIEKVIKDSLQAIVPLHQNAKSLPDPLSAEAAAVVQAHANISSQYCSLRKEIHLLMALPDGPEKRKSFETFCDRYLAAMSTVEADATSLDEQVLAMNSRMQALAAALKEQKCKTTSE